MKPPELAEAAHARRHAAEPLEHVELVQALIEEHAATLALPRRPPTPARVVGLGAEPIRNDPVDTHNLAKFAVLDELTNLLIAWLNPHLKHPAKHLLRVRLRRRDQALGIGLVRRDRLFHHNVQPRLQGLDPDRRV